MTDIWEVPDAGSFAWRLWEGQYVLYNDASGDTHAFGDETAAVIETLVAGPCDAEALLSAVGERIPGSVDADRRARLEEILGMLVDAGLVQRS